MREAYHEQLQSLTNDLAAMCRVVGDAMRMATRALLEADLELAERVIGSDTRIDELRAAAEEKSFAVLALQAPVAGDLRIVLAAIHVAGDLERMGALALHVAKATRRRHPQPVLPEQVRPYFAEMARVALNQAEAAANVIASHDLELARKLEIDDDAMDDLHRHLFTVLMGREWPHGVPAAVDVTLLGRFYERYSDHAVAVARRVVFLVTGKMPEPVE